MKGLAHYVAQCTQLKSILCPCWVLDALTACDDALHEQLQTEIPTASLQSPRRINFCKEVVLWEEQFGTLQSPRRTNFCKEVVAAADIIVANATFAANVAALQPSELTKFDLNPGLTWLDNEIEKMLSRSLQTIDKTFCSVRLRHSKSDDETMEEAAGLRHVHKGAIDMGHKGATAPNILYRGSYVSSGIGRGLTRG